jgi:hypothetical protein
VLNWDSLIDPFHLDIAKLDGRHKNHSIYEMMQSIFGEQFSQVGLERIFASQAGDKTVHNLFYSLEAAENIQDTYLFVLKKYDSAKAEELT